MCNGICDQILAAGLVTSVSCRILPPWFDLFVLQIITEAGSDGDLGDLEVKSTPQTHCAADQTIPEPLLSWDGEHYSAEKAKAIRECHFHIYCFAAVTQCSSNCPLYSYTSLIHFRTRYISSALFIYHMSHPSHPTNAYIGHIWRYLSNPEFTIMYFTYYVSFIFKI